MVIKMLCLIAGFLGAYAMLAEAATGIVWGPDGESRCDMRFEDNLNMRACDRWPGPTFRGNTGFMRVFRIVTAYQEAASIDLRGTNYRCPNLQNFYIQHSSEQPQPQNCPNYNCYANLIAERIIYGSFFLVTPSNQQVLKGKFGPLFVRAPSDQNWTRTVPGFDHADSDYAFYNYFVPYLRRDFNDPSKDNYDSTLKEWSATQAGKRDFLAGASLSVICRDEEKNCEPPIWGSSTDYLIGYIPLVRGTSYDMYPEIKTAYIDLTKFHFDLKQWVPPNTWSNSYDQGMNYYIVKIGEGGLPGYSASHPCRHPRVQFVLYDSNPTPHNDACDTDPSRWNRKNGEVRAVFAQFSKSMEIGYQTLISNGYNVQTTYLVKSWDFTLDNSNWKEDQLKFLAAWQNSTVLPEGLDERDTGWYKNWKKATGMSVAFTFCACKDSGFDDPNYSCIDYLHKLVEIKDRAWLA